MDTCSLYEMMVLVRAGLWPGGAVEKLGVVGAAVPWPSSASACGLTGVYVSYDAMVESCTFSEGGGCRFVLSLYCPYAGTYSVYALESDLSGPDVFLAALADVMEDKRETYVWSHNINKRNIFALERRYGGEHSSVRSGKIGSSVGSRMFRR